MSLPATYKPSPLSIGSPRTSPFRRPESPANNNLRPETPTSPSLSRPSTPTATSPAKPCLMTPSKLQNAATPPNPRSSATTPRNLNSQQQQQQQQHSPSARSTSSATTAIPPPRFGLNTNTSISSLPPNLLNALRKAFSTLDRSSTGSVSRADVTATLANLGLPSQVSDTAPFFPPGSPQSVPLAQFLGQLAGPLSSISREEELLNAFGAFDERDCGEINKGDLRDALMHTGGGGEEAMTAREVEAVLEGFCGRKAFGTVGAGGHEGRREVFRYREWVDEVVGKEGMDGEVVSK